MTLCEALDWLRDHCACVEFAPDHVRVMLGGRTVVNSRLEEAVDQIASQTNDVAERAHRDYLESFNQSGTQGHS